ncbi:ArnT family glycosyltransferase [Planctomycetaceae bacterium SH139]
MSSRHPLTLALLVLTAAFAVRAGSAVWWQQRLAANSQAFAMGDSDSYWHLASTIAAGEPYQYHSPEAQIFRAPGYPYILSWLIDSPKGSVGTAEKSGPETKPGQESHSRILAARLLGSLFGTLTVGLVMLISWQLAGSQVALLGGILAAVYPGAIAMSILVLSEAPFQLCMMLTLGCLAQQYLPLKTGLIENTQDKAGQDKAAKHKDGQGRGWYYFTAWLAGCAAALGTLLRPSWLLFLPFYFALRILLGPQRGRQFCAALTAGLAMAIVLTPWWLRNYQVTGHFVPTTLQVGASLYDGLHPGATGASDTGMNFSIEFAQQLQREDQAAIAAAVASGSPPPELDSFEYRLNKRLATAAIDWASDHPGEVLSLAVGKLWRTWWPWPTGNQMPGGRLTRWAIALGMLMIVLPSIWRIATPRFQRLFSRRAQPNNHSDAAAQSQTGVDTAGGWQQVHFPFLVPTLYFALLHAIFVGSARYRQPALLAMIVVAAPQYWVWLQAGRQAWQDRRAIQDKDVRHEPR